MKFSIQQVTLFSCIFLICMVSLNAAKIAKRSIYDDAFDEQKFKRSPFLRLDELSNKIYLAKNKLGAGLIDPLDMSSSDAIRSEYEFASTLYEGILTCTTLDHCSKEFLHLTQGKPYWQINYNEFRFWKKEKQNT